MKLYFEYPYYWLIPAAFLAAVLSFLLYRNDKLFKDISPQARFLMISLRYIFIFLILALILNPIYRSKKKTYLKPLIVIAHDNTQSIVLNKDSLFYKNEYLILLKKTIKELEKDYDVKFIKFDDKIYKDSIIDFSGKTTNISNVFREIIAGYSGMNLGAVVLCSDGIYNSGINPLYTQLPNVPVYTVALGDTMSQKDILIKDVISNKVAFLGNKFPVRVVISAEKCNEKEAEISISRDNKILYKNNFEIPKNENSKNIDVDIPADVIGTNIYKVKISYLDKEISYVNNHYNFNVKIVDNRSKILILSDAPHPDIGAIKFALKNNPDYELDIYEIKDFIGDLTKYNLVILHQLPSLKNNASNILKLIQKEKIPVLFILGVNSAINEFNRLNTGIEINVKKINFEDATASPNPNFTAFDPGIDANRFFKNISPLKTFFGEYKLIENVKVLLYQNINGIKTSKPLIAFIDNPDRKTGIILGEGIWRWRMDDYKYNNEHTNFTTLFNKTVQFLLVRKLANKLNIEFKPVYSENEQVFIDASFINETYDVVKNLDIKLKIVSPDGKEFSHIFGNRDTGYRINLGRLPAGKYSFIAETKFENNTYSEQGEFYVEKINLEFQNTTANHSILNHISQNTGAKLYYPAQLIQMSRDIKNNKNIITKVYEEEKLNTISNFKWLFFIILLFAALEWSLRKYFGGY